MPSGIFWGFLACLFASGALALVEIIKKKNAQAGEAVEKIAQFQGYIGLGLLVTGIIYLFDYLGVFTGFLRGLPVSAIVILAALVSGVLLGIFQAIDLGKQWGILSEEKGNQLSGKLASIKIPLGFVAVASSLYVLLWRLIQWRF